MSRSIPHVLLATCMIMMALVVTSAAHAGPPLLCHPIQIGDAKSLPWGDDVFTTDKSYDASRIVDDTLALLMPETPVLVRLETMRRAALYIDRDTARADRIFGALLARTLDAEVVMDPKVTALRYLDAGYWAATMAQAGVTLSFGPGGRVSASEMERGFHAQAPGYAWAVRGYKIAEQDADFALALALITADTRMSEHTMFLERAATAIEPDDALRTDLLAWIGEVRGVTVKATGSKQTKGHDHHQR